MKANARRTTSGGSVHLTSPGRCADFGLAALTGALLLFDPVLRSRQRDGKGVHADQNHHADGAAGLTELRSGNDSEHWHVLRSLASSTGRG
jgi:hypothetical protein